MKKNIYSIVFILLPLFLIYAEDYVNITINPATQILRTDDTVTFTLELTAINGFTAAIDLSTDKGSLSKEYFSSAVSAQICTLSVWFIEDIAFGDTVVNITAKNGSTILSSVSCTVSVKFLPDVDTIEIDMTPGSWTVFNKKNSIISDEYFVRISEDENGVLWFSHRDGLISIEDSIMTRRYTENFNVPNNTVEVSDMEIAPNGDMWISFSDIYPINSFIKYYNGTEWQTFNSSEVSVLSDMRIIDILADKNSNDIWITTICEDEYDSEIYTKATLIKYDGTFWSYFDTSNTAITENEGFGLLSQTKDGRIWMSGNSLYRIDNNAFIKEDKPIFNNSRILEDTHGAIWYPGAMGIIKYAEGIYDTLDESDCGLFSKDYNIVRDIEEDINGCVWYSRVNWEWILSGGAFNIKNIEGVYQYNGQTWLTQFVDTTFNDYNRPIYWDMHQDSKGILWMVNGREIIAHVPDETYIGGMTDAAAPKFNSKNSIKLNIINSLIEFYLQEKNNVSLSVIDVRGRSLFSQNLGMVSAGKHFTELDLNKFGSGMLFVQLKIGSRIVNKKITLF